MKKILTVLLFVAALMLPMYGHAETGIYVTPKFVLNYQHNKSDISGSTFSFSDSKSSVRAGFALAAGYDFMGFYSQPLRAEIEYGIYGQNSMTKHNSSGAFTTKFGVQTLLVNGYWDVARFSSFVPYVGVGLGLAFIRDKAYIDAPGYGQGMNSELDVVFAGQIGVGCSYEISDRLALDLGYRYLMLANTQTSAYGITVRGKNNHNHQLMLGARISF